MITFQGNICSWHNLLDYPYFIFKQHRGPRNHHNGRFDETNANSATVIIYLDVCEDDTACCEPHWLKVLYLGNTLRVYMRHLDKRSSQRV